MEHSRNLSVNDAVSQGGDVRLEPDLQALRCATLEAFLPLTRMKSLAQSARLTYQKAKPFPYIILDDFFNPGLLDLVLAEFPLPGQLDWGGFSNKYEVKLSSAAEDTFGAVTRLLMYHLNSITFLDFLGALTGIENLMPDPTFNGGGMHQSVRGGKLGIHADFNRHKRFKLDRRLNVLVYLNKDWREEYGGYLELWDRNMTCCEVKASPAFNRVVIFNTTDFSYHGHPEPLQCPEGVTRKSLALYYYTNGRPRHEVSKRHSTLFQARRKGEFGPPSLKERLRALFSPHTTRR